MNCYTHYPQSCSRPPRTHVPLETPGHSQASMGQSPMGWLLPSSGSGAQGSVYALQESFSQSCLSSCSFMLDLMVTSSKRAYAIPKSAAPRAPFPVAVHCWTISPQKTLKHSSLSLCGIPGPWSTQGLFEPSQCLWREWGLILNVNSPPPTILLGLLLCPWLPAIFSLSLKHLPSYWGFSDLECGVSPQGQSNEAQPLLLTLDVG